MANVLIVDANLTTRLLLTGLVEEVGFTVVAVADAAAAVDRLRQSDEALVVVVRAAAEPDSAARQELAAAATAPQRALLWVATRLRRDAQVEELGEMTVPLDVPILLAAIARAAQRVDAAASMAAQQRLEPPELHLAG